MALLSLLAGVLVCLVSGAPPQAVAPEPGQLRWVRGIVSAASPTSVTLRLRDGDLTLSSESDARLVIGERVEAHYTDRKGERRAVLFLDPGTSGTLSKRPGRSYRGTVDRMRRSTLSLRVEGRRRDVTLDSRTTLSTAGGRALASGRSDVAAALSDGEPLLVIYDEQSDDMMAGDVLIPGTARLAREIRRIGVPASEGAGVPPQSAAPGPGHLRWVRGVVAAASPTSVTLTLRESSLTLVVDPRTAVTGALTAGDRVDAHYTDIKGELKAILILDSNWLAGTLSSRPGQSYRGTVDRMSRSTLLLRVETQNRDVHVDSRTVLFSADGRALATGRGEVAAQLTAGEPLLVIFDQVADDVLTTRRAREIRKLR